MMPLLHAIQKISVFVFLLGSMFGAGLSLTWQGLIAPLRNVRLILIALALNFLLAPGLAWLLTKIIPLDPGYAIALLLLGGAAGAPFLPKLAATARGDLALAVALMALLTCGTILFMPFALPLLIPGLKADAWSIAQPLLLLIVSPLVAGMLVKRMAPSVAARLSPILAIISNVSLLLLFGLLIGLNIPALRSVVGSGSLFAAILYVVGLFAVAWMLPGLPREVRGVLALAGAARNFGAALVPAAANFNDDPKIAVGLIVNAVAGLVLSFLAAAWLRRKTDQPPEHIQSPPTAA